MAAPPQLPHRSTATARALSIGSLLLAALACGRAEESVGTAPPNSRSSLSRPNVLLISIDSLRRDHLSLYGRVSPLAPEEPTTPHLDALGAEGVVFEDAVALTSWTLPSHVTLLTGQADRVHGVTDPKQRIDPALPTLAERLGAAGYDTAGFFSGPNLHPAFGFSRGFERYVNCGVGADAELFESGDQAAFRDVHGASHRDVTSPRVLAEATDWIRARAEGDGDEDDHASRRPWFAFVHWWDPHYDYLPPAPYDTLFDPDYTGRANGRDFIGSRVVWSPRDMAHLLALYDGEIRYTDEHLGRLFALLEELQLDEDTLVVVVSDHGDEFYEHGKKGHQRNLFEESIAVPLLMRWPGVLPAGVRAQGTAGLADVAPTIAQLVDLAWPAPTTGRSLRPLWEDTGHPGFAQPLHLDVPFKRIRLSGLRTADTKVVWDHVAGEGTVYRLDADPGEQHPRAFTDLLSSPAAAELRASLEALEEAAAERPRTEGHTGELLPESVRAELEKLGYL